MTSHSKKSAYRMLFLIATPKLVRKAEDLLKQEKIPVQHLFHAQGTATEYRKCLYADAVGKQRACRSADGSGEGRDRKDDRRKE